MMKKTRQIILILLALMFCQVSFSIPAQSGLKHLTQKDKRVVSFYLYGDEYLSFARSVDGYTLLAHSDGNYYYATLDENGDLVCSKYLAANPEQRTEKENLFLKNTPKGLSFSQQQIQLVKQNKAQVLTSNFPTTGNNPLLVILVEYPDRPFTFTNQDFTSVVMDSGYSYLGATGSVKDYFRDNSKGLLNLSPTVVGPFTLSHEMAYYGAEGPYFQDIRPKEMASEACQLADSLGGVDFTQFDVNNDGVIDAVHIIFAGKPQSTTGEADAIWPHRWTIYEGDTIPNIFDGKILRDYSCSGEKRSTGVIDGIGTICHEFGHVLGLPDFYDTDYEGTGGTATALSSWSVMASGSYNNSGNTPPIYNANERAALKWITLDTLDLQGEYIAYPLIDSNRAYIMTTPDSDDYYLIENRSLTSWDAFLPNKGLLIYHIKESFVGDNCLNCDPEFQKCDIVEADNDKGSNTLAGDVFTHPYVDHYFTTYSQQYCFKWSDMQKVDKPITQIAMDSLGNVSFRYLIPDTLPIIKTLDYISNGNTSFTLRGQSIYNGVNESLVKGFLFASNSAFSDAVFLVSNQEDEDIFTCEVNNLNYSQQYYFKAVAIANNTDTIFAQTKSFQTTSGQPTFLVKPIVNIGLDTLEIEAVKIADGVYPITEYGFVYDSVSAVDTLSNRVRFFGDFDTVKLTLQNLEQNTKYWVRFYLITELGIKYSMTYNTTTKFIPIENNEVEPISEEKCYLEQWAYTNASEPLGGVGDFQYLWQQKESKNGSWHEAEGVNNELNYNIDTPENTIWLRRLVFSHNIKDTSNTIQVKIRKSIPGDIVGKDSLQIYQLDTLVLKNYTGEILSWNYFSQNFQSLDIENHEDSIIFFSPLQDTITFEVYVQDSTCPSASVSREIYYYNYPEGLEEINGMGLDIDFSPNPAKDYLHFSCKDNMTYLLTINSLDAKTLLQQEVENNTTIDLHEFPSGSYILTIESKDKKQTSKKLIINR